MAAVTAEGGFEPSELAVPKVAQESAEPYHKPRKPDG